MEVKTAQEVLMEEQVEKILKMTVAERLIFKLRQEWRNFTDEECDMIRNVIEQLYGVVGR